MDEAERAARARFRDRLVMARMLTLKLDQPTFAARFGLDVRQVRDAERAAIPTSPRLERIVAAIEAGDLSVIVTNVALNIQPSEPHGGLSKVIMAAPAEGNASEPHAALREPNFGSNTPARARRQAANDLDADRRRLWRAHFAACRAVHAENAARHARYIAGQGARLAEPDLRAPSFPEALRGLKCGAKTRAGGRCKSTALMSGGRCKLHGGCSTGPTSTEGRAAAAANLSLRWAAPSASEAHERTANHKVAGGS
jgi:hypothetical protein